MAHGCIIVIKKNGEDGSKCPLIEKQIKIGNSTGCSIILITPHVSNEHCQLTVLDDGQVKVQNLSETNPTLVNETVVENDIILEHCDVLNVGGRLFRWEYLKESPYYQEIEPPQDVTNEECVEQNTNAESKAEEEEVAPKPGSSKSANLPTDSAQLKSPQGALLVTRNATPFPPSSPGSTNKIIRLTPQAVKMIKSGNRLHLAKNFHSPLSRRKSEAIKSLSVEDLDKIVTVNGEAALARTPVKSSPGPKVLDSPYVDQSKRNRSIKPPLLDTIGENQSNDDNHSSFSDSTNTNIYVQRAGFSLVLTKDYADISSSIATGAATSDENIPSSPSSSQSTTPEKSLIEELPNTPTEIVHISLECTDTPPEVKTPAESPEAAVPLSPMTPKPILRILVNDVLETPPEVMTPESLSPKPALSPVKTKTPETVAEKTPSPRKPSTPAKKVTRSLIVVKTPSPNKRNRSPNVANTPTSVRRNNRLAVEVKSTTPDKRGQRLRVSAEKQVPLTTSPLSPRNSSTRNTASVNHVAKEADARPGKSQTGKRRLRASSLNAKVARAFGIKSKLLSTPDKGKSKALLVLGKAVKSKSQTQQNMRMKLMKKATQTKNLKKSPSKETNAAVAKTTPVKKSPPAKPTPRKTPKAKLSPSPRSAGVRSSKRISSKIEIARPDFTELSPSALGLAPRPGSSAAQSPGKQNARRRSPGGSPAKKNQDNSDVTEELFTSPLTTPRNRRANTSVNLMEFYTPVAKGIPSPRSFRGSVKKAVLSILEESISNEEDATETAAVSSKRTTKTQKQVKKSPANSYLNVTGVKALFQKKSPRNDLSKIRSIRKLMKTPPVKRLKKTAVRRPAKSPKNDLSDVKGVREMFSVKKRSSPRNDLTDVRGVRNLMRTPKNLKSPKNDLTDVRGVRNLLGTPKNLSSPKNDLRVVSGLKELFASPSATPEVPEVFTPAPRKRTRGALGTPKAVDTPLRRGRSSTVATPQTRSLRTRTNTLVASEEPQVLEATGSPAPTRGRKKTAAKPDSAQVQIDADQDSSPSSPKKGRKAAPKTPLRTRSRRAKTDETNKENVIEKKTTRGKEKAVSVKATHTNKNASPVKSSPSPSPKKRPTRARTQTASKKKTVASPAASTSPKGRKASAKASAKSSPEPKKRTRGAKTEPAVKRATRGRAAAAAN